MRIALPLTLAAVLATASTAVAATPQEFELRSLGQCALAGNLYKSLMAPGAPIKPTDADKALYARLQTVTPALSQRAEALAMALGAETSTGIRTKLMAELKAQIEPTQGQRLEPRAALDRYAPILEACVVRGEILSGTASPGQPEPETP